MSFPRIEPLAPEIIDRLFSALVLRYGNPFLDRWRDLDFAVVKGDWARQLSNFGSSAFRYALDHLPEKPPTVIDFRKLCNAAPAQQPTQFLTYDPLPVRGPNPEEREQLRVLAADIRAGTFFGKPSRNWAYDLIACYQAGVKNAKPFHPSPTSLRMAREAIATDPKRFERNAVANVGAQLGKTAPAPALQLEQV